MARANKYTAINFNDIYENKTTSTVNNHRRSSSSTTTATPGNKTILSNSRIHGNMLVLNLPSPKSVIPHPQPSPAAAVQQPDPEDSISLRPLGRTGTGPPLSPLASPGGQNKNLPVSPKTNKFVPPHLRPGFVGREDKQNGSGSRLNLRQVSFESPKEEERPKSGGGYERLRRGSEVDPVGINRSRSIGSPRPNSSG
ncbi:uncharacterized protein LOC111909188 [Lactuca sativa]|uniref:uncharacterized protein LOC111909188 n=1 Tax=Lactuca sativa TaxID=4236 RepID=UPI000CBCCCC0|nr:uncharacterized protein LOC111909188 [Lactuca sativa]